MKTKGAHVFTQIGFSIFVISLFFLISSCGGGGGSGSGGGSPSSAGLFITDSLSDTYRQVLVTLYKVEFEETGGAVHAVFNNDQGATYDLRHLSGVMSPLAGGGVPAGSYRAARITVGEGLILVDNAGAAITPTFAQNASTTCSAGRCAIAITGAFTVASGKPVILDFDLKQFTLDPLTNTVTAVVVVDDDGSDHSSYASEREDDFDLKGVIQTVRSDGFDLSAFRAEGFVPTSNVVPVTVNNQTQYRCDDDDDLPQCGVASFANLQTGLTVEVKGNWNGAAFVATSVEVDSNDDIDLSRLACSVPSRSRSEFTGLVEQASIESTPYTFNATDFSITVGGKTILITKETLIKVESNDSERIVCADAIPASAGKVEVYFAQGKDAGNNTVFVASKIEFKSESGPGSGDDS